MNGIIITPIMKNGYLLVILRRSTSDKEVDLFFIYKERLGV